MVQDLAQTLADLKEEEALALVQERLSAGQDPLTILGDARRGMEIVGQRFATCEYFLPDLLYSGEILKEITQIVRPRVTRAAETKRLGKVVIGTVAGDIHDIGKDIVVFMLDVNGFEVQETGAVVVGLSGLLTLAYESMKETARAIGAAGLRDRVKIMIGGPQVDEQVRKYTDADAFGLDAMAGVSLAQKWVAAQEVAT